MTSLIGIVSLLSALAATSYALNCTQCTSLITTCSGPSQICPSGYQCGTSYSESNVAGVKTTTLVRSCVLSSHCGFNGSVGVPLGNVRMGTSCCNNDNCTPNLPKLPTVSSNRNGLVCRYCVSTNSAWCYTDETVQCTGDQDRCLLQTTQVSGAASGATAIRGCATKSVCDLGGQSASDGGITSEVKFICTSGGLSVHNVVLTPAIVCLLLMKWFI